MEFHRKQRFSIRKYAIGVASVLIGLALVGPMVAADTVTSEEQAITASAVDTAQTTEENHPVKEEEVRKPEEPSLPSTLDSGQTEGVQPSDKGNEPDKVSTEKEAGSNITPEPEKRSENDYKQPVLDTSKKVAQENIEEKSYKEVAEAPKNELDEATPVEALVRLKEEKHLAKPLLHQLRTRLDELRRQIGNTRNF